MASRFDSYIHGFIGNYFQINTCVRYIAFLSLLVGHSSMFVITVQGMTPRFAMVQRWLRNRKLLCFFAGVTLYVFLFLQAGYEPLTVTGIKEFSNLQVEKKPTQVLIYPKWKCKELSRKNTVIMVLNKASNALQRKTIRHTWGHPQMQIQFNFSLYFVIGKEGNRKFDEKERENEDVLQVDIIENYFNISEKVVESLKWASEFCNESRYFLKIDDDVYFNLNFLRKLQNEKQYVPDDAILGDCLPETKPFRWSTKFKVSSKEYPFARYPPYCGGPGYAMTIQTARKLYREMVLTQTYKFEDVHLGIIAYKLGISMKAVDYFVYAMDVYFHRFYINCAIMTHNLAPEVITQLWNSRNKEKTSEQDCSPPALARYLLGMSYG